MKKLVIHKISQLVMHTIFWCAVLFFYTSFFSLGSDNYSYVFSFSLFLMPITIATTYVFIYKIIPDYLVTKRYFLFGLYSVYVVIISVYLIVLSVFYGLICLSGFQTASMAPVSKSLLLITVAVYLVVIVICAFKLIKINFKSIEETKKLENKILQTQLKLKEQELNYLKMQIHPHFLFNTLNTMYGFALKRADETPEMILKLSNLLDYLLYKVDKPFVLLSDEINHIKDYIELEKMRFNENLTIEFNIENISEDLKIAPMLLIPFVENSFKHGAIKSGRLCIYISLYGQGQKINFEIENTHMKTECDSKGIGLINIEKRLELVYSGNYKLSINNSKHTFKVNLELNLN